MPADLLYESLRRLAVEDPREARKVFLRYFDSGGSTLEQFLGQISSPADGRLRHLVASALRNNRDKERLAPYLITWHEIETDEFAKRAIAAALDGVKIDSSAQTTLAQEVARLTTAIGRETAERERLNRELEIAREVQEDLSAAASGSAGFGVLGAMQARTGGGWRLLRFPGVARRQVWNRDRRRIRQRRRRRADDGKSRSVVARLGAGGQ